jgi:5'-3' exoribonuclease 2
MKSNEADKKPQPLITKGLPQLANSGDGESEEEPDDGIRLWEAGWKERYYQAKFGVSENNHDFRKEVSCAYVEGLCWVLQYYYQVFCKLTCYYFVTNYCLR